MRLTVAERARRDRRIAARRRAGASYSEIAEDFGLCAFHVGRICKRHGVIGVEHRGKRSRPITDKLATVLAMRRANFAYPTIAGWTGLSVPYVRALCARRGVEAVEHRGGERPRRTA